MGIMAKFQKKFLKNKALESHTIKDNLFLIVKYTPLFLILLLFLPSVMAFEFDNSKTYNPTDRSITIKNTFLGLFPTGTVAKVTPLTPHINYVFMGKERLVAEFEIESYEVYTEGVWDGMEFYNLNVGMKTNRDYKIKYVDKIEESISPVVNYICNKSGKFYGNGTEIEECSNVKQGETISYNKVWKELDAKAELPKGKITIGLFADVLAGDKVEFIPEWFGVKMPEYAIWEDYLDTNLVAWYKLNETSGNPVTAVDSAHGLNALSYNNDFRTGGIIAGAYHYEVNRANNMSLSGLYSVGSNYTVSFWLNMDDTSGGFTPARAIWFTYEADSEPEISVRCSATNNMIWFRGVGGGYQWNFNNIDIPNGVWKHYVLAKTSDAPGNAKLYINGVLNITDTSVALLSFVARNFIGDNNDALWAPDYDVTGNFTIDEIGIFNKTLNQTEVTQLYNGGSGITYEPPIIPSVCETITTPNVYYTLDNNVESAGTCFTINAINVTLDCQGHTINYSTGSGTIVNGVKVQANYTTIKNCKVTEATGAGNSNNGINIDASSFNTTVENNTIIVWSVASSGVAYSSWAVVISNNIINASTEGISVLGYNSSVYRNNMTVNSTGISISNAGYTNNNIYENNIYAKTYGMDIKGYNNTIYSNFLNSSTSYGLQINLAKNVTIFRNDIKGATIGLYITGAGYNNFTGNNVTQYSNSQSVVNLVNTVGNNFTDNFFYTKPSSVSSRVLYLDTGAFNNTFIRTSILSNEASTYGVYLLTGTTGNYFEDLNVSTKSNPFYINNNNHNVTLINSKLNMSASQFLDFFINNNVKGEWNLTNVTRFDNSPVNINWTGTANGTLNVHWYFNVNVTNTTGSVLDNVNISIRNSLDNFVDEQDTSSGGNISTLILQQYKRSASMGTNYVWYSPYKLTASRAGYLNYNNLSVNVTNNYILDIILELYVDTIPPNVTINSPANTTYSTASVLFNVTSIDNVATSNCTYSFNNGLNNFTLANLSTSINDFTDTNTTMVNGGLDVVYYCTDTANLINNTERISFAVDSLAPGISIVYPENNSNYTQTDLAINYTYSDNNIGSCWWTRNAGVTNTTLTCGTNITGQTWSEGLNNVIIYANDTFNHINFSSVRFRIDTTAPVVSIIYPTETIDKVFTIGNNITLNWTVSDAGTGLESCWIDYAGINTTVTCGNNNQTYITTLSKSLVLYANDSLGNVGRDVTTWDYVITEHLQTYNASSIVGAIENFAINISQATGFTSTSTLFYNGTSYSGTKTGTGLNYVFDKTIIIPTYPDSQNSTFYWQFSMVNSSGTYLYNSTLYNQSINNLSISDCSSYSVNVYNFTLSDEGTRAKITSTDNVNTTIELDTNIYGTNNLLTPIASYSRQWNNESIAEVCINIPINKEYIINTVVKYSTDTGAEEYYYIQNNPFNSQTLNRNITLYDLLLADSTSCVVSYVPTSGIARPNVVISPFRYYVSNGTFIEVEAGLTDNDGETILHLVEEDVKYKFQVSVNGTQIYLSDETSVYSSSTTDICRLNLLESTTSADFETDYSNLPSGTYSITSNRTARTITLEFNLPDSGLMNLTVWKMDNNNASVGTLIGMNSTTASSGSLVISVPTSYGNTTYIARAHWDNSFLKDKLINFFENPRDYFPDWTLFLVGIMVLSLALMAVSSGVGIVVFSLIGIFTAGILGLINMPFYLLGFLIAGGIILLIKLVGRRR